MMSKYRIRYILILGFMLVTLSSCWQRNYRIGMSQCYHNDWNLQLERDLRREANSHPEIDLTINLSHDGIEGQIRDIRKMVKEKVDLLIIAPDESDRIKPIIDEVLAANIPVILYDGETTPCNYTALIYVDNKDIGHRAAQFAYRNLEGQGKVISVVGLSNASSAHDRHTGFVEGISPYPGIQIIDSCETNWTYASAYPLIDSLITIHPDVDLIGCQNDPLAIAAYDVCIKHNLEKMPIILGIDGLMGEGKGIESVLKGKISATCTNPTGSQEAMNLAMNILQGLPYDKINVLKTQMIDQGNVRLVIQQEERIDRLNKRIEEINGVLGQYFQRTNLLMMLCVAAILLILIIAGFAIYVNRTVKQKALLRQRVVRSNQAKLTFFANVSHSFRTPLTLIAEPINTLLSEEGLSERQKEMLQMMQKNTDELQKLVGKVLDVLQDDLLKSGERLDAIAQPSAKDAPTPEQMRNRVFGADPAIEADATRRTVLVIDDNPDMRKYLTMALSEKNYLVLTAPNGEDGLDMAKQNVPDLIICDVMMPGMNGLECCRLLKADVTTCHIPVLILTAYALDDQRIQSYQSGADAYITKPFNIQVLCARISNLITNQKRLNATKDRYEEMEKAEFSPVDRNLINHFHSYVTENISNPELDIPQLCEEFGMSRVQLYRKCKSITGQSPVELIRIIRLKAATVLLETTDKSVSEIGYETGFSSPSYFAKCYKDQYNESPTDVQKRAAEKKGV